MEARIIEACVCATSVGIGAAGIAMSAMLIFGDSFSLIHIILILIFIYIIIKIKFSPKASNTDDSYLAHKTNQNL
ncbi:MAG: hypothetical protein K2O85_05770 [Helicobacter sp.]|nr:hypothetical protein [Helicobacter sp.]